LCSTNVFADVATVVGYFVVSRPFLNLANPRHLRSSHSELLEVKDFVAVTDYGESCDFNTSFI